MPQTTTKRKYTPEESKAFAIRRRTEQKAAKALLDTTLAGSPTKSVSLADLQARYQQSLKA